MLNKLFLYFKIQSKTAKTIFIILFPLLAFIIIYFIIKSFFSSVFVKVSNSVKTIGSTLTSEKAKNIANKLDDLIQGYTSDSDQQKIVELISPLSLPDFNKVSVAFGLHKYSDDIGDYIPYVPFVTPNNLYEILGYELSDTYKELLKQNNLELSKLI